MESDEQVGEEEKIGNAGKSGKNDDGIYKVAKSNPMHFNDKNNTKILKKIQNNDKHSKHKLSKSNYITELR